MKKNIKIMFLLLVIIVVIILGYPFIKKNYYKNYLIKKSSNIEMNNIVVTWKENGIIKSKEYYKDNKILKKEFNNTGENISNQLNDYSNNIQYIYQDSNNYNEENISELLNQLSDDKNIETHKLENNTSNLNVYNSQLIDMLSDLSMKLISVKNSDNYCKFYFEGKELDMIFIVDINNGLILNQILYSIKNNELNVWEYLYETEK